MARIGWFTWQPELSSNKPSSAGGAVWTKHLLDRFTKNGHEVLWLADGTPPRGYNSASPTEADIVFLNWRWSMPAYPERELLYQQQMRIIAEVGGRVPIIVHDQDHMISSEDWSLLQSVGAIITAPELSPREGVRELHFPDPFRTFRVSPRNKIPFMMSYDVAYIGNVYGRYEMAKEFLGSIKGKRVAMWGNWLDDGHDRPSKEQVLADFPEVRFKGRLQQSGVIQALCDATATIHLFKESYGQTGFVTLRWAEAAASATAAFIPYSFKVLNPWFNKFLQAGLFVKDGADLQKAYQEMTERQWELAVLAQQEFVDTHMRVEPWLMLVEESTK